MNYVKMLLIAAWIYQIADLGCDCLRNVDLAKEEEEKKM